MTEPPGTEMCGILKGAGSAYSINNFVVIPEIVKLPNLVPGL